MYVTAGMPCAWNVVAVFLDGVKQDEVTEANDAEGWIVRYVIEDGRCRTNGYDLMTERVHGKVVIKWKGSAVPAAKVDFSAITREIVGRG